MSVTTEKSRVLAVTPAKREWSRPQLECLESRPEVTAYAGAGDSGLWIAR